MKVEIGAEATLFPEKEYINGLAVAVWYRNEIILSVILEGRGRVERRVKTGLILCQKTISRYCPFKPIRQPGNKVQIYWLPFITKWRNREYIHV